MRAKNRSNDSFGTSRRDELRLTSCCPRSTIKSSTRNRWLASEAELGRICVHGDPLPAELREFSPARSTPPVRMPQLPAIFSQFRYPGYFKPRLRTLCTFLNTEMTAFNRIRA